MAGNSNLQAANKAKNDEFYTQLTDIEKEMKHYKKHFKGKTVFCNCDDPESSNFWQFFYLKFKDYGLKRLLSTHYEKEGSSYMQQYDGELMSRTHLECNGDFRSNECKSLLEEADIVVTNPPFSLFREYVSQLMEYDKKFIIIGNKNAITYKEFFPLLKDNKVWIGVNNVKEFKQPDGSIKKFGNIGWYTNMDVQKRHENIILYKTYSSSEYPKYDNYDAINVDRVSDIPLNYDDVMGVPITFLDKYNPEQFEIIKFRKGEDGKDLSINGKCPYFRILIQRKEVKK